MSTFSDLQAVHEELVRKEQLSEDILEQARQYLKDIQSGSRLVSSARERDQLRANLRYWAGYVYEKTGEYPNVDLSPSIVPPQKDRRVLFSLIGGVLLLLFSFALGYFGFVSGNQVSSAQGTMVAQTQTAAMWTPTPVTITSTPGPNAAVIVNAFNGALRGADPLEEALDAKFSVMDIGFDLSGNPPVTTTMLIQVECDTARNDTCSAERAFVALAHVFEKDGVRKKIMEQVPVTVTVVQVRAFDHMNPIGIIEIGWKCLLDFANGNITGDQLAARVLRFSHP